MRIHLVGRLGSRRPSGLMWAARITREALTSAGVDVSFAEVRAPPAPVPEVDAAYLYGDFELLSAHVAAIHETNRLIPITVNSTFDGRGTRAEWVRALIADCRKIHANTWAGVFTGCARDAVGRNVAVVTPKVIRQNEQCSKDFDTRSGVCVGEAGKLANDRLSTSLAVDAIEALIDAGMKPWAYDQYGADAAKIRFPGLRVEPTPGPAILALLGQAKCFVSFAAYETFAMVPVEAMACGTPLLHYPQPQSLDEYAGAAAFRWTSVSELIRAAGVLNSNADIWRACSAAGKRRAAAFAPAVIGGALALSLVSAGDA